MIIGNALYSVEIDKENGRIKSLSNGKKEFIKEETPLFRMSLRDINGEETRVDSDMAELTDFTVSNQALSLVFAFNSEFEVIIDFKFNKDIRVQSKVINKGERAIEWISCPCFAVPNDLIGNGGTSKILWGFNEGAVIEDINYREKGWFGYREPKYPGEGSMPIFPGMVQMQCMAYYGADGGLYIATHDNNGNVKSFDFQDKNESIEFDIRLFTGAQIGADYEQDYPFVMKFFEGDWQVAAEIYRGWFEENKQSDFKKITQNENLPDWYKDSPVVITYPIRGKHDMDIMNPNNMFPYMNAMAHIERLSQELDSKIMVILMHWEGSAPWSPPYVWPPYGGEDSLKEFIDALHKQGNLIGVYCSGLGWTEQSLLVKEYNRHNDYLENNFEKEMCASPQGIVEKSHICDFIRSGYDFCPTSEVLYNILKNELKQIVDSGIDYVQILDQNHGGNSYFCYSKNHGHPPVPGKWQIDAVKKLLGRLNEVTKERKVLLGCESAAGESYIPELLFSDNRYELCYNVGKPVPLYGYLYHEYVNNFSGNQVCTDYFINCKKSPESLCLRIAHSFIAGDMLTLVLSDSGKIMWNWGWREYDNVPNQDEVIKLVKNLNYWRKAYPQYLLSGQMVQNFNIDSSKHVVYQRDNEEVLHDDVYYSAWTDGNKKAQFIVNYNVEPKQCKVDFSENKKYEIVSCDGAVQGEGKSVEITVSPLSAIMIETAY